MFNQELTARQKIWMFFDEPKGFWSRLTQVVIIMFILLSVAAFLFELFYFSFFSRYEYQFYILEAVAVTVFIIEYLCRLWSSPKRLKFIINFYSAIDLFAILPFFLLEANFGFIRALRVLRVLRASKFFRVAKIMRPIWDVSKEKMVSIARIVQENVIKNIIVIILLICINSPIKEFLYQLDPEMFGDVTFATSIFVLAAMFGFFSLSYRDVNSEKLGNRLLIHATSGLLMLPIGIMFIIIQHILTIQIGFRPNVLMVAMWLVYVAVVLWDFSNVKRIEERLEKK